MLVFNDAEGRYTPLAPPVLCECGRAVVDEWCDTIVCPCGQEYLVYRQLNGEAGMLPVVKQTKENP